MKSRIHREGEFFPPAFFKPLANLFLDHLLVALNKGMYRRRDEACTPDFEHLLGQWPVLKLLPLISLGSTGPSALSAQDRLPAPALRANGVHEHQAPAGVRLSRLKEATNAA